MTQDEIIQMARQAGMSLDICHGVLLVHHVPKDGIEAFAKLVAAKERERIYAEQLGASTVEAIRARGEA